MKELELEIRNPSGLHARPAAIFVRTAAGFRSSVRLENLSDGRTPADAKSILSVLGCGVGCGHRVRITADGEDEEQAIATLSALIEAGLGEPLQGPA